MKKKKLTSPRTKMTVSSSLIDSILCSPLEILSARRLKSILQLVLSETTIVKRIKRKMTKKKTVISFYSNYFD